MKNRHPPVGRPAGNHDPRHWSGGLVAVTLYRFHRASCQLPVHIPKKVIPWMATTR